MDDKTALDAITYVTRNCVKYKFRGVVSGFEDLWSMNPDDLDDLYSNLTQSLELEKRTIDISLIMSPRAEPHPRLKNVEAFQHMITAVVYVRETMSLEMAARIKNEEKRKRNKLIMEIIDRKRQSQLENKSIEELEAMLEEDANV